MCHSIGSLFIKLDTNLNPINTEYFIFSLGLDFGVVVDCYLTRLIYTGKYASQRSKFKYIFVCASSDGASEPPSRMCYSIAPLLVDFTSLRHFIADFIPVLTSVQQIQATSEKFTGSI